MFRPISLVLSLYVALVVVAVGPSDARADDQVDNPQFKAWTNFGIGSSATLQLEMQVGPRLLKMSTVRKLVEKADDHIVIEIMATTDAGGTLRTLPAQKMTIPAKSNKVEVKDLGTEEVTVAGKTLKCQVHEVKGLVPTQPDATAKVWLNTDVPGHVVKLEATTSGNTISQLLTSFEVK